MELGPRVGVGRTAAIFVLDDDRVVKLYDRDASSGVVEREAERTRAASDCGVRVPAVSGTTTVDGRPGVVFERVRGSSVWNRMVSRPWLARRESMRLARLHARVHDCEPTGLPRYGERVRASLSDDGVPADLREDALRALDGLDDGDRLLHGDFHPGNVLEGEERVVIDWVDAAVGDPAADVARTLVVLRSAPTGDALVRGALQDGFVRCVRRWYRRAYLRTLGVSIDRIRAWLPVLAAARLSEVDHPGLRAFARSRFRARD